MVTALIDTLSITKHLQAAGFNQQQADAQAEIWSNLVEEKIATKMDVKDLEIGLKRDINDLETEFKRDFKELELRLTIELGSMMALCVGIIAVLVRLL